jgi:signal recognition particle receptor subunit alpha
MSKNKVNAADMEANTIKSKAQLERERLAAERGDDNAEIEEFNYDPTAEANFEETDSEDDFEEDEDAPTSRIWSAFQSITGTKPLTQEDLTPALNTMRDHLITKNVAVDIADAVCQTVGEQLVGQTCGTFTSISRKVKDAMKMVLTRVLNPVSRRNVLTEIARQKRAGRPYSIAFVGVNGVGKSTSLAKIAYYLKRHNLKVSVCACDTFRSGAVEQLNTHGAALKMRIFSQGYNTDPSEVAYRGLKKAFQEKDDVVLIDTAGRMQGKAHLMRELAKLIERNRPDLVLFVGEALVGNDGVDQLVHFNKALEDHSQSANPRLIDGIVLTKFDTVDDKVGAAISMCHVSQKPIMFVGVGQNYPDMKRLNVSTLLGKLLR